MSTPSSQRNTVWLLLLVFMGLYWSCAHSQPAVSIWPGAFIGIKNVKVYFSDSLYQRRNVYYLKKTNEALSGDINAYIHELDPTLAIRERATGGLGNYRGYSHGRLLNGRKEGIWEYWSCLSSIV